MIEEAAKTLLLFCLLLASAAGGAWLRLKVPQPHRGGDTIDFLRIVTALLVTFAALVMSLLLASVRNSYDTAYRDRSRYASSLAELDSRMRNYGPALSTARGELHGYTAAVIASTWPDEPPPTGLKYPDAANLPRFGESPTLGGVMNRVGMAVAALQPEDPLHKALAARCAANFQNTLAARWAVIEDVHGSLSTPFAAVLTFWLMLVFLSFGLQAPRNRLAALIIAIAVVSVSSVIFVILDLDLPYGGVFGIPSASMRQALAIMLR